MEYANSYEKKYLWPTNQISLKPKMPDNSDWQSHQTEIHSVKAVKKLSKYKDLKIVIARIWNMETETILVVRGCTWGH